MLIPWEGVQRAVGEGKAHATEHAFHGSSAGGMGFALGLLAQVRLDITRRKRRWPPLVRREGNSSRSAHSRTVAGCIPSISATWRKLSQSSPGCVDDIMPLFRTDHLLRQIDVGFNFLHYDRLLL